MMKADEHKKLLALQMGPAGKEQVIEAQRKKIEAIKDLKVIEAELKRVFAIKAINKELEETLKVAAKPQAGPLDISGCRELKGKEKLPQHKGEDGRGIRYATDEERSASVVNVDKNGALTDQMRDKLDGKIGFVVSQ